MRGTLIVGTEVFAGAVYAPEEGVAAAKANRAVNCALGLPGLKLGAEVRDAGVCIVGFGPSLKDTWEQLRDLPPCWTVSKAHDFLVERGIVPGFHTDVDFRQHKAAFVTPRAGVRYIMSSHVHPEFIRKLTGYDLRLFHSQIPGGGPYEAGCPQVDGQFDASLQAAKIAYDLGYRKQHWFGVDGSMLPDGTSHAGPHEGVLGYADPHVLRVAGKDYQSNGLLVRAALAAETLLRRYPKLDVTIHGDGALRPFLQERGRVRVQ